MSNPITKAYVIECAEAAEKAIAEYQMLARLNSPTDVVAKVEARAQHSLAFDKEVAARQRYDNAFRAWKAAGFPE